MVFLHPLPVVNQLLQYSIFPVTVSEYPGRKSPNLWSVVFIITTLLCLATPRLNYEFPPDFSSNITLNVD
jgi:hypothetical protein